jgi:hypothetical protein
MNWERVSVYARNGRLSQAFWCGMGKSNMHSGGEETSEFGGSIKLVLVA